jgi:hypothetical protein
MSISRINIQNYLSNFEKDIENLRISCDSLTFRVIINDIIKSLSLISQSIANRENLFGKKIVTELLINIISYLPCKYKKICQNVCTNWKDILKSDLSRKILLPIPKGLCFSVYIELDIESMTMARIRDYIYFSNYNKTCKIDITNYEQTREENKKFLGDLMSSNSNYICINYKDNVNIYSLNMTYVNSIKTNDCRGLVIDNNDNILIATNDMFHIYDIKGKMINWWFLDDDISCCEYVSRHIASNGNEIFIAETLDDHIYVFSYEGDLIRVWGKTGNGPGEFVNPRGIAIYRDVVFVSDSNNRRIQAFTYCGKFMFEYLIDTSRESSNRNILIVDDNIYVDYYNSSLIAKFKLICD